MNNLLKPFGVSPDGFPYAIVDYESEGWDNLLNEYSQFKDSLFSKDLLAKCQFKWQELAGKELLIKVGHYPDELGKGMHVCVMGVDKTSGKCYVLHTGIEECE